MSENAPETDEQRDGARLELTPDTIHEEDDGQFLDCPACGSPASITQIIERGRCTGSLDAENTETYDDDQELQEQGCTAALSLELVWES